MQCPFCKAAAVRRVRFTWRGGWLAAKWMRLHRCGMCEKTFNAKTGKPAGIMLTVIGAATLAATAGAAVVLFLWASGRI